MTDALTTPLTRSLRVGIIGAAPELGRADEAHVPAVAGLAGLDLWALAGHGLDLAGWQGARLDTPRHFQSGHELIADPDVEVVTVAGGVPWQREFVLAALGAGKHVYCEWPLGRDLAEARELAAAARAAKVKTAVGRRWCTDWSAGEGFVVGLEALDALQAQRAATAPHPQDASAGHQLAGL